MYYINNIVFIKKVNNIIQIYINGDFRFKFYDK